MTTILPSDQDTKLIVVASWVSSAVHSEVAAFVFPFFLNIVHNLNELADLEA